MAMFLVRFRTSGGEALNGVSVHRFLYFGFPIQFLPVSLRPLSCPALVACSTRNLGLAVYSSAAAKNSQGEDVAHINAVELVTRDESIFGRQDLAPQCIPCSPAQACADHVARGCLAPCYYMCVHMETRPDSLERP